MFSVHETFFRELNFYLCNNYYDVFKLEDGGVNHPISRPVSGRSMGTCNYPVPYLGISTHQNCFFHEAKWVDPSWASIQLGYPDVHGKEIENHVQLAESTPKSEFFF